MCPKAGFFYYTDKYLIGDPDSEPIPMKTYLTVTFNSEGAKPSEVTDRLCMLGFKPCQGTYDYVYEWDKKATVKDAIWFGDKVHETLKGYKVLFKLETI
jgi:hypothetical protein